LNHTNFYQLCHLTFFHRYAKDASWLDLILARAEWIYGQQWKVLIWEITDLPQVSEAVGPIRLFGYFAPISEKPFRGLVDDIS
jgi:hypothetical protein